ncbi:MAG TPA: diguanylate cyclase, partial [Steroidobacteraceae bacterium]
MWFEGLLLLLLAATAGLGAGWLIARTRLGKQQPQREDLTSSSLITETERRMLELVAKGAPLSEVLNTLTEAIERISPESHCTIMLLDEEHRRRLLMASGPSLPPDYLQATNGLEIGPEVGACGSAAYRNETVVIEDIATDSRFEGAREFVLSHGLRSVWSQPVRDSNGSVLGTFAIYRRQVSSPRPQELRLVRVAGQLAGNAIERIRAEKQLSDAIRRLNLAERVARFGIWEADFQKNIVTLSEGLAALFERPPSRFQLTPFEFEAMVHPDDRHDLWSSTERRKARAGTQQAEFRLVLPSGTVRWVRSQWAFEPGSNPPTRATGAMIDVTNEKDMLVEAEQERAAAETSARVARQAERLEQDRKMILELVANDQPLEQVAATMATTVASHLPGSLCAIRIHVPDDEKISLYPDFPPVLAAACEGLELASIKETLNAAPIEKLSDAPDWSRNVALAGKNPHRLYRAVPVMRDSQRVGIILSLLGEECADSQSQQKLLESWGRFASLAVERRGLYKQLSFRAQYDSLTNLLNRASLYERLAGLIRGTGPTGSLAIIYLDLDSFKEINDTLGHAAGDFVLKHVARQIVTSVRRTDAVARIGGDEFVVVLPGVNDRNQVVQVANTVAQAIAAPVEVEDRLLTTGASLGISMYPIDGEDTDTLLKVADESMYKVKLTHRSRRASEA